LQQVHVWLPEILVPQQLSHLHRQVPSSKQRFDSGKFNYLLKSIYALLKIANTTYHKAEAVLQTGHLPAQVRQTLKAA
jgi:hypothetical protein